VVAAVKALACQLPAELGLPLSRLSISEIQREVVERGLVASIGETTLWRWLSEDAIRPWYHRSWLFPRDPAFEEKAGRVLDLYAGLWEGIPLDSSDCVLSADEKTSIQARRRVHRTRRSGPGTAMRVEHEYQRRGAWAYLAAWDVRRAKIHGRCERKNTIAAFERLVQQVMRQEPYRSSRRVFWVMDNGTTHRGQRSVDRLRKRWPTIIPVHTPVHASWLNQIDLLLHRPAQGAHPERLPLARRGEGEADPFRPALRRRRRPLSVEIHSRRPVQAALEAARGPAPPEGRLIRHRTFGPEY